MCLAGTRLLVEAPAAGEFLARFTERARMLRQGDPRDDTTDVGPNITREHLERVDGFVRRAVAAGARPVLGGAVHPELGGLYYQPTLLTGAAPGSEILTEEVFGPVLTLQTFSGEAEAAALANSTRYGLAATLFTGDRERARASRPNWWRGRSGSTASSSATCARRSAGPGSRASAGRAAPGASTSTAT